MVQNTLKHLSWQNTANSLRARSSVESVIATKFQATETDTNLGLTKEKYSISTLMYDGKRKCDSAN
jgi:hypothetical protein